MLLMITGGTPKSPEEYWRVRTQAFNTAHRRLCVIRDLIHSLPSTPATLLDVGCGRCTLRSLLPANIEYFGVDLTLRHFTDQRNADHFEAVDLDQSPAAFGTARFDAVVCSGVLEYIAHPDDFFCFLRKKVSPSGHLILSFTNRQHYRDLWGWVTGRQRQYKDPHVNFMLIPQLVSALRTHGFEILRHHALTLSHRSLPVLGRFRRFPLNVLARQYIFLCAPVDPERVGARRPNEQFAASPATTRTGGPSMLVEQCPHLIDFRPLSRDDRLAEIMPARRA